MSRFRDFDVARDDALGEPLRFKLAGQEFTCRQPISAGPLLELAGKATLSGVDAFQAFGRFLFDVVTPEQSDAFREALRGVGFDTLFELCQWIIEETTGRPFGKSASSQESASSNGPPSRVVSLSPVKPNHSG